ncbi:MAG TPA: hypothetical protein VFG63_02655 [Nocardioidaceae bacterium]|nr:hypothetical protein [Nocardioidaceae bacterium]
MRSSQRNIARAVASTAAAAALLVVGAGGAFAHECYVANRSDQGNTMAGTNSQAWETVSLDTILTVFIGLPQSLADCVEAKAPDAGIPSSFVLGMKQAVGQEGVIAENNPNMSTVLGADGQGIDHAEDAYGDAIGALIGQCSPPA